SPSRSRIEMLASPAAQQVAWPEYVMPCRKTGPPAARQNGSAISSEIITPPSGREPPGTPLANTIIHGLASPRATANHIPTRPQTAEAADHRVDDQQDPVTLAHSRDALDVAGDGRMHAAGPNHGLHEEGGDALGADRLDRPLELLHRITRHLDRSVRRWKPVA